MPKKLSASLDAVTKEGVIIHSFSDLSGVAFYNSHSNEVLNVAASEGDIYKCYAKFYGEPIHIAQDLYAVFLTLNERGMFKQHECD